MTRSAGLFFFPFFGVVDVTSCLEVPVSLASHGFSYIYTHIKIYFIGFVMVCFYGSLEAGTNFLERMG